MFEAWTKSLNKKIKKGYRGVFYNSYCSNIVSSPFYVRIYMENYIANCCDKRTVTALSETIAKNTVSNVIDNQDIEQYKEFELHVSSFFGGRPNLPFKINKEIFLKNYVQAIINSENQELINRFLMGLQFEIEIMLKSKDADLSKIEVAKQLEEELKNASQNFEEWEKEEIQNAVDRVKSKLRSKKRR